ncbi:type II secretion system protein [Nitrospirillum pindoramense]|uniref:Type II secretory pathway pseudopilin PulG n=1 Tax=Nitrospirillum amazonense TaxID=28077 RepID=A0A560H453_9PROT|nr:type II secretion system protein [Nitrospirillum amazonense]TWB41028.1 type II secretory pathway pseudopilin PulG [Nitrospirillum amazonense]
MRAFPNGAGARPNAQAGFTYLALLILLALVGLVASASLQAGSLMRRRQAEEALLDVGTEFRLALRSYADATPAGLSRAPHTLEELLRDPRYPGVRRHLRRLEADPLTGQATWGLVRTPDGAGILGIYSLAPGHPIKRADFPAAYQDFNDKDRYADWVFVQAPPATALTRAGARIPAGPK